ncbi:MAG TPA: YceD family protein [Burkholderiaceae bacterium]|nr:YceD family protein [Burkholderiaceae bacterium]
MSKADARSTTDVFELARVRGIVEGRLAFDAARRLRTSLRDAAGAIDYRLDGFIDERGRPAARLQLRGDLPLTCDHCGRAMNLQLDHEATFYLLRDESELAALPVVADEEVEPLLGSTAFDVSALVEDEAILCIPVSPRHAECAMSAEAQESSTSETRTNPFAKLPGLLRKNGR